MENEWRSRPRLRQGLASFEAAAGAADLLGASGVGFVFSQSDGFVGVDLDDLGPDSGAIIGTLNSYSERSVSGRGAHVIVRANLNGHARKRRGPLEIYEAGRYFAFTGDHLAGAPTTIEGRQAELEEVLQHFLPAEPENGNRPSAPQPVSVDDQELLDRATKARNGREFAALWNGDYKDRFPSQSEADLALASHLAFYSGGDNATVDRLFRSSGLMRDKWDTRRGDSTYGAMTVAKAISGCQAFYDWSKGTSLITQVIADGRENGHKEQPLPPHSWTRVDLVALGETPPEPPGLAGLIYKGQRHVLSGEPEALKTWLALVVAAQEIRAGLSVLYIDLESTGPRDILARLRNLGLKDDEIADHFSYFHPDEPISVALSDIDAFLTKWKPSVVFIDAMQGALALHQLDENSATDIETFYRIVVDPLRAYGAAVVTLDHVTKATEGRGKWSIGSQRKIGACDVALGLEVIQEFGRGRVGKARIRTHKDRPGYLSRPNAGEFELTSDKDTQSSPGRSSSLTPPRPLNGSGQPT
jgi:NrS-1  polymerase HBD domain/AAA domain